MSCFGISYFVVESSGDLSCASFCSASGLHQGEECKRQLAILFSFMEENQPSELIEGLLGDVDNGRVSSLIVTDPGGGYTGSVPKV